MRIVVGGILHERWTVNECLDALFDLDTRGHEVVYAWVVDGSCDRKLPGTVVRVDGLEGLHYRRQNETKDTLRRIYERLACLRNILAQTALSLDGEALFSVDSDIVVPRSTLLDLVNVDYPWVAALVQNAVGTNRIWNVFHLRRENGLISHFMCTGVGAQGDRWPEKRLWTYDPRDSDETQDLVAGAVCLYGRPLLLKARWCSTPRGSQEDIGFGLNALEAGYHAGYVPIVCKHLTIGGTHG